MGCPELFTLSFRMMGSLLLWISIVLIALDGCTSATAFNGSEWLLEISTVHCPPSHHCGVYSNKVNERRQSTSCCVECSCEDDCLETSNCCPYKETKSNQVLFDFSLNVKAAPHECVIRTSQPVAIGKS